MGYYGPSRLIRKGGKVNQQTEKIERDTDLVGASLYKIKLDTVDC